MPAGAPGSEVGRRDVRFAQSIPGVGLSVAAISAGLLSGCQPTGRRRKIYGTDHKKNPKSEGPHHEGFLGQVWRACEVNRQTDSWWASVYKGKRKCRKAKIPGHEGLSQGGSVYRPEPFLPLLPANPVFCPFKPCARIFARAPRSHLIMVGRPCGNNTAVRRPADSGATVQTSGRRNRRWP